MIFDKFLRGIESLYQENGIAILQSPATMNSNLIQFSGCVTLVVVQCLLLSFLNWTSHFLLCESSSENICHIISSDWQSYAKLKSNLLDELFFWNFYCNPLGASHQQCHEHIRDEIVKCLVNTACWFFNSVQKPCSIPQSWAGFCYTGVDCNLLYAVYEIAR